MFIDCGSFRVLRDYKVGLLRIFTNTNPISGWRPMWKETATFRTAAEWYQSVYSRLVSEFVDEDIAYFWFDVEESTEPPNDPSH